MYKPITRLSNYLRQKNDRLQGETDESTIIVGDFNSPLSKVDRSIKQKISKDTVALNTINQLGITDIYTLFDPTIEWTCFSSSHETFIKIDHILAMKHILTYLKEHKSYKVCS